MSTFDPAKLSPAQKWVVCRKHKYPGARGRIATPTMRCLIRKGAVQIIEGSLDGLFAWQLTPDAAQWAENQRYE